MDDQKIVELFLNRDETAVPQTMAKYANFCRNIAADIVADPQAVEDCLKTVCDTIRETLPERGTRDLPVYLARVTRSVSMNRWKQLPGALRRATQVPVVTEELSQCVIAPAEDSAPLDRAALTRELDGLLNELDAEARTIFMARYWFFRTTEQIAAELHVAPEVIEASLIRSRETLKQMITYPAKPGNLLSCLGKVSGKFILPPQPQAQSEAPVRRPRKKKKAPLKLIVAAAVAVVLVVGLVIAGVCGLFSKNKTGPDGLIDGTGKPGVGLNDDGSAEEFAENGSLVEVGSGSFAVLAAVYNEDHIQILVKAIPGSNDIFLIPQELGRDDSTTKLAGLNGIPEGTIDQYASYLGRKLAKLTFTYAVNGTALDGSSEYAFGADGVLYYCFTAPTPEGGANGVQITGSFYQDLEEATDAQTADIGIKLSPVSDAEKTTVSSFDDAIGTEAQLQISSAVIEKNGLGYHVTFEIQMAEDRELLFLLTDSNGDPLPALPGHTEAVPESSAAGLRTYRVSCQLPEDNGTLCFTVTDQDTGIEYGPYSIQ